MSSGPDQCYCQNFLNFLNHLNFVAEGLLKVKLGWATVEEDALHVGVVIG
jgi:hypothetical protein